MSKSKLLGQFLQETQPPFALELYLHERTYHKTSNLHNPSKLKEEEEEEKKKKMKKKKKKNKNKRQNNIPNCSVFLKVLFGQIVSVKKINTSTNGCQNSITPRKIIEEEDVGFHDDFLTEKQAKAERKLKCRKVEQHKQLSPVSVLIETESDDDVSPLHCKQCYISKTTQGESSTITSSQGKFKKPTYYNTVQEFQQLVNSDSYGHQYILNKKLLQQKKQLLIDYAREVIQNQKKKELRKILGADELWKLVCEDMWIWSQHTIDESNSNQLLHFDFLASEEEWSHGSQQQKKDIANQVGDAILGDIINEIVL